jgi:predicted MFS family arabinose efflux permease
MGDVGAASTDARAGAREAVRPYTLTLLMLGNIFIGAGVLAPAAMMNTLTADLAVTPTQVGALIGWGAVVLCLGAPTLAFATTRIDRRTVLVWSLIVYGAGHAASIAASSYEQLLLIRLAMIAAAAVYTPQAASAVTLMIGEDKRASAVAFVFLGWSIAGAAVVPLMTIASDAFGWRAVYLALAMGCALAAAGVAARTPGGLMTPPLSVAAWRDVLARPAILVLLATTALQVAGQFVLFPYLAAELRRTQNAAEIDVALTLALYGAAGLAGAAASSRLVARLGAARTHVAALATMAVGLAGWAALAYTPGFAAAAVFVWGLGFAAAVSMQQARLIAVAPGLASASVALNTSALYLGQAVGAAIGAAFIDARAPDALGVAGCAFMLAALAASAWTARALRA